MAFLKRALSLGALLAAAMAVLWFISAGPSDPKSGATGPAADSDPDVYGRDVEYQQLKPDGTLHYRLHAERIEQFSTNNLTRMAQPVLHLPGSAQAPWDIQAEVGFVRRLSHTEGRTEEVVDLQENVEMVQVHPANGPVVMRSEKFLIYPGREYAETDHNVIIDTEVGRTIAAGLHVDLETGLVQLNSDADQRVHTIVLPEQFKKS